MVSVPADRDAVGEGDTIRVLYDQYERQIRLFCTRRLPNRVDVDDAVQETFLRAQRGLHRFEEGAPVWPWLVTIAAHVCADIHRGQRLPVPSHLLDLSSTAEPDEHVAARARRSIVDEALRSLPDRYRTSIYLRHFEGSSYEEIARSQGMSVASVRSVLLRGRRQLGVRIRALAQVERQWPLPSTITVAAQRVRERARHLVRDVGRIVQGAVAVVESAASFGAYFAGGPATMFVAGALSMLTGGVGVSQPPLPTDAVRNGADALGALPSGPVLEIGNERTDLVIGSRGRPPSYTSEPPFFAVETPSSAVAPGGAIPPAEAGANGDDRGGFAVYVNGLGHTLFGVRTDCQAVPPVERTACDAARTALTAIEQGAPDESGPGVGTGT